MALNTWYPQPTTRKKKINYLDLMKELVARGADVKRKR